MRKRAKSFLSLILIALLFFLFVFSGCSKYANQEQLAQLNKQKEAALAAEKSLEDCQREKRKCQERSHSKCNKGIFQYPGHARTFKSSPGSLETGGNQLQQYQRKL